MDLNIKKISELTVYELHNIYALRSKIFVVEQNCVYQDIDDIDLEAYHLFYKDTNGKIIAYTRAYVEMEKIKFGRVITNPEYRKQGFGQIIVQETINFLQKEFPKQNIYIQAQAYLLDFYQNFGFKSISEIYLEDNIPHLDMVLEIDSDK